jgi:hypothetical protein
LSPGDGGIEEEVRKAEAAVKQGKQKDYYKILGVSRQATTKEIKKVRLTLIVEKYIGDDSSDIKQ